MAGIEDLVASLLGGDIAKPDFSADDPYLPYAGIANSLTQAIGSEGAKQFSTRDRILGSLITGLAGGAAQGFSSDYQNRAKDAYKEVAVKKALGLDTDRPNVLSADLFKNASSTGDLFRVKSDLAKQQAAEDLVNAVKKERLIKTAGILGENDAYGFATGAENPNSPQYKISQAERTRQDSLDKEIRGLETDYTTKLTTGPTAQSLLETQNRGKQVLDAIQTRDPLNAAAAIYGFAKVLDPDGVVRKEDGSIVANPGGPAGQLASFYNTIMQEGQLTDDTVASMEKLVPKLYANQYGSYESQKDAMVGAASKQGASVDKIGFIPRIELGAATQPTASDVDTKAAAIAELKRRGFG